MSSMSKPTGPHSAPQIPADGIGFTFHWVALPGWLTWIVLIALASALISCSPPNENPTPAAQVTRNQPLPPATRTTAPTPTPTPTRTPTLTPTPQGAPTPPANGITLTLSADLEETGWVGNSAAGLFRPDNDLNVGVLKGQAYSSIVQFDLSGLAPGSKILYAAFEITGATQTIWEPRDNGHWMSSTQRPQRGTTQPTTQSAKSQPCSLLPAHCNRPNWPRE